MMKIFGWWRKRSVEVARLCPECNAVVPVEDYHSHSDLAICRCCNAVFHPSEYEIPGSEEAAARDRGLLRIRVRQRGNETWFSWYSGLRGLAKFVSLVNKCVLGVTLVLCLLFASLGFVSWTDTLYGAAALLLGLLIFEGGVACLVLPLMLLFAPSKIVLKPGKDGFHIGTYYRARFLLSYQFPLDADSRVFLTLQPTQLMTQMAQMGQTGKIKTLLTIRTDTVDGSFGENIPENEKKVLASHLWRYIRNLKVERGLVVRHPEVDEQLRCPVCNTLIPLVDVYPSENVLVCDHCGEERPFPPDPRDHWLDELIELAPPHGLRIRNRSYGLWIRAGTWWNSIAYGFGGTIFLIFSVVLLVTGSIWLVHSAVLAAMRMIRKGSRWTIVLRLPTNRDEGQIVVKNSHWFFRQKIKWNSTTHISLRSCFPSIQGPEVPSEIEIRTGNLELRFGREMELEHRRYIAAILRAAIQETT